MKRKYKFALGASVVALSALTGVKAQALSVQELANVATPIANEYGLYPSVVIAQGILESSYGQSSLANNYNNIFGVKYSSGNPVYLPTEEYVDGKMVNVVQAFQSYSSLYDAVLAHAQLLRNSRLYAGAWRENASSYLDATAWLQGRYATDPDYAAKLDSLIAELGLTAYDSGSVPSSDLTSSSNRTSSSSYHVRSGDTLSAIAAKYGVTVSSLVAANGLTSANDIRINQLLKIGASSQTSSSSTVTSSSTSTYTVQAGDNLSTIAAKYGTTVSQLATLNGITDANSLQEGQQLTVGNANSGTSTTTTATTTSSSNSYRVQAGDSLSSIALKHGTTVTKLLAINQLSNADSLSIGQEIELSSAVRSSSSSRSYTVQSGDSLYSIATANGMTPEQLAAVNGLGTQQTIHPGQTLQL